VPAHHLVHAPVERIAGAPHFSRAGDEGLLPAHLGERLAGAISWHGPGRFGPGPRIIAGAPAQWCAGGKFAIAGAPLGRCAGNDSWAWPGGDIAERGICCRRTMVQVRRQ
jgi:hypothetical protein